MIGNQILVNITIYFILIALSLFITYWLIYLLTKFYEKHTKDGRKHKKKLLRILLFLLPIQVKRVELLKGGMKNGRK